MKQKTLFQLGDFTLHSGGKSFWKIDCDALTDEDLDCLARLITEKLEFDDMYAIPKGGVRLCEAIIKYNPCVKSGDKTLLIVDDVLTTCKTMNEACIGWADYFDKIIGVVIFALGRCPDWVHPIFQLKMEV